jgi:hypothetical protein
MPPYSWPIDPAAASNALSPAAGPYLAWAWWAVDGLHYIDDASQDPERRRWIDLGHGVTQIDVTNARSAASNAATALDLCAAALGVHHAVPLPDNAPPERVHDVRSLKKHKKLLGCEGCVEWLDSIHDNDYRTLTDARHALVHRIARQHATVMIGTTELGRTALSIGPPGKQQDIPTKEIVRHARDTATTHVVALLRAIEAGKIV